MARKDHPETPDGRYFVARGRLWRKSDPGLSVSERRRAIKALMRARLEARNAVEEEAIKRARASVEDAKFRLGEAGPVWWTDGAPDEHGLDPSCSSYASWWSGLSEDLRLKGTRGTSNAE
jgi:hypothetical protein